MAAAVCGGKRSFFEDSPSSSPVSKRPRCVSATSPPTFTPPQQPPVLDRLRAVFPHINPQLLERALEEYNNDFDSAIKKLNELCSGAGEGKSVSVEELGAIADQGMNTVDGNDAEWVVNATSMDGAEWVDLFIRAMTATSMDDAKARVSRVLEMLEKSIMARPGDEAVQSLEKENMMLKEQIEILVRENSILKRAVAIQHERQKEYEIRNQELQHLKQLLPQYQEQLRIQELNNYTLTMQLRQATEQSSPIPGRFHPDVF